MAVKIKQNKKVAFYELVITTTIPVEAIVKHKKRRSMALSINHSSLSSNPSK
jgi:hypothetical protein